MHEAPACGTWGPLLKNTVTTRKGKRDGAWPEPMATVPPVCKLLGSPSLIQKERWKHGVELRRSREAKGIQPHGHQQGTGRVGRGNLVLIQKWSQPARSSQLASRGSQHIPFIYLLLRASTVLGTGEPRVS